MPFEKIGLTDLPSKSVVCALRHNTPQIKETKHGYSTCMI